MQTIQPDRHTTYWLGVAAGALLLILSWPVGGGCQTPDGSWLMHQLPLRESPYEYIVDPDSILTAEENEQLNRKLESIHKLSQLRIDVVFVQSIGTSKPKPFATALFERMRTSRTNHGETASILIFTCIDSRRTQVEATRREVLSNEVLEKLQERCMVPHFSNDDFAEGINALTDCLREHYLDADKVSLWGRFVGFFDFLFIPFEALTSILFILLNFLLAFYKLYIKPNTPPVSYVNDDMIDDGHPKVVRRISVPARSRNYPKAKPSATATTKTAVAAADRTGTEPGPLPDPQTEPAGSTQANPLAEPPVAAWSEDIRYREIHNQLVLDNISGLPVPATFTKNPLTQLGYLAAGLALFSVILATIRAFYASYGYVSLVISVTGVVMSIFALVVARASILAVANPPRTNDGPSYPEVRHAFTWKAGLLLAWPILLFVGNGVADSWLFPAKASWAWAVLLWICLGQLFLYYRVQSYYRVRAAWQDPYHAFQHLRRINADLLIFIWLFPPFFIPYFIWYRRRKIELREAPRNGPSGRPLRKLSEAEEDAFLSRGQQLEEKLLTVDHDVWIDDAGEDVLILPYEQYQTEYSRCPNCRHIACHQTADVIKKQPTHEETGIGLRRSDCKACGFKLLDPYVIPVLSDTSYYGSDGGSDSGGGDGGSSW